MISIRKRHKGFALELPLKTFLFPGGEVGVKLDTGNLRYLYSDCHHQTIVANITSSLDVMTLIMAKDALERFDPTPIHLFMPYVPYGRQDRVCVPGEAFSLKAFASLTNSLGFAKVIVADPHSDVTPAVFDRLRVISQFDIINYYLAFSNRATREGVILISPDAGANKKTSILAKYFNHEEFIRADKLRNLSTGEIKETIVYADRLDGKDIIICDDICDGGRTFIELAKVLKSKKANKVILYVSHGIFSKGIATLLANGIDEVYTTNSFYGKVPPGGLDIERATVLDLEDTFSI